MLLGLMQKKGNADVLDGRLTVFARVEVEAADILAGKHPVAQMVNNGMLVVQGNYRDQNSLRDFLKSEMGISLEDGLQDFLEKLDGLESALDPDKLREKMENIGDIQDFIPTPAKIVPFNTEEEILAQEGDVFFTGYFNNVANANLSVNALPILYQARFREQQIERVRHEIEQLITQVETSPTQSIPKNLAGLDVEQKILKEFIPYLIYCRKDRHSFSVAEKQFRTFLHYPALDDDVAKIVEMIASPRDMAPRHYRMLELYARKIDAICHDKIDDAQLCAHEISQLESESSDA